MSDPGKRRIAIVGAGPIGIEAAVYAQELGYAVDLYDRESPGAHVERWGFVELFSPWSLNVSTLGLERLRRLERPLPDPDAYPTGREMIDEYLGGVCASLGENSLHAPCEVVSVTRQGLTKRDAIGTPERAARRFRLVLRGPEGPLPERSADIVLDASGVYGQHGWLGDGGEPAGGEKENAAPDDVTYHIPDVLGKDRDIYAGKTTILAGVGYSAITTLRDLDRLAREANGTKVIWLRRDDRDEPVERIENDPLPQRAALADFANQLASSPPEHVRILRDKRVVSVDADHGRVCIGIDDRYVDDPAESANRRHLHVDRVVALVGYRPDSRIHRELHVHLCYATEGPMKLAAALLGASETTGGDCLAGSGFGPDSLRNPEPNFYILGSKSYGRRSDFLLKIGREQIRDVFRLIENNPELDLYTNS